MPEHITFPGDNHSFCCRCHGCVSCGECQCEDEEKPYVLMCYLPDDADYPVGDEYLSKAEADREVEKYKAQGFVVYAKLATYVENEEYVSA